MRSRKTQRTTVEYEAFIINGKVTIIANLIPFPAESDATCWPHHAAAPEKGKEKGKENDIKLTKEKAVETAKANDDTKPAGVKRSEVHV